MSGQSFDWSSFVVVNAITDVGLCRANNQDSYAVSLAKDLADWQTGGHLLVVADGMGAHAAGELASRLAVEQVVFLYRKHRDQSPTDAILNAIRTANDEVHRRGQANLSFHNMGTTCSTLLLLPQGAVVGHVGDSRIYRIRRGVLQQLTFDHSLVWELQQVNKTKGAQELSGIPKNVITRSIGPHATVKVDLEGPFPIEPGDVFLMCSDGLSGPVTDAEMATALTHLPLNQAAHLLVDLAVLRGGKDNITMIIAQIVGDQLATRPSASRPLTISDGSDAPRSPWIGFWFLIAAGALLSVLLLAMGQSQWAQVAMAATVVPLVALMIQWLLRAGSGRWVIERGSVLGQGPYTEAQAESPALFAENLQRFVEQAVEAARSRHWNLHDLDKGQIDTVNAHSSKPSTGANHPLPRLAEQIAYLATLCRENLRGESSFDEHEQDWILPKNGEHG